ncbi:MAG: DUF6090 family protein [Gemmatimonadota bacterium]|nr:DUF6090 family protein [Gemmatimonadota bacterium]MDH3423836.1 DUF6090 family protein [Gemmatimonadota bacterium]
MLIVTSVYLAVFLESASQDRSDRQAARSALVQLLGELRQDQADFQRIIGFQNVLDRHYSNLARWLEEPSTYPADSVAEALFQVATDNPTLFARSASWNTMISAGQLAALEAPALVLQLGQLYETIYSRIDYNSSFYDQELGATLRSTTAIRWNTLQTRPLTSDQDEIERLASRLEMVHVTWNIWYRDLLMDYEGDVSEAIAAVEAYLGS